MERRGGVRAERRGGEGRWRGERRGEAGWSEERRAGGIFSAPWGARWTPPRSQVPSNVIKRAHPTSNSAGSSSVGSLAPPRATPRLGSVYVSCQYFPCSFVLALRELGLRLGVKAQLPLRASSRGVLPGPGALAAGRWPVTVLQFRAAGSLKQLLLRASKTRLVLSYCFAACTHEIEIPCGTKE
jgi:hypothetical protein